MKAAGYLRNAATVLILGLGWTSALPQKSQEPIFVYHSGFWLSLHHYLYVLGRVEARTPDIQRRAVAGASKDEADGLTKLTVDEVRDWKATVHEYSTGLSRLDVVFNDRLIDAGRALAHAKNQDTLKETDIEKGVRTLLERAAPIYRKAWWPEHEAANRARIAEMDALVQRYGRPILAYITRAYGQPWPWEGYPVQFTPYSNWAGAFSTTGRHLVMASLDPGIGGALGLETLFHEAMHQWDDPIDQKLSAAATAQQKKVPVDLSHAMIFYAAGEAVRSVIPDHRTYAETRDMWSGPFKALKPRLDAVWKPYVDGRGTLDDTIANLLRYE